MLRRILVLLELACGYCSLGNGCSKRLGQQFFLVFTSAPLIHRGLLNIAFGVVAIVRPGADGPRSVSRAGLRHPCRDLISCRRTGPCPRSRGEEAGVAYIAFERPRNLYRSNVQWSLSANSGSNGSIPKSTLITLGVFFALQSELRDVGH